MKSIELYLIHFVVLALFLVSPISYGQNTNVPEVVKERKFEIYSSLDSYRKINLFNVEYLSILIDSEIFINTSNCMDNISLIKVKGVNPINLETVVEVNFILDDQDNLLSSKVKVLNPDINQFIDFEIFYDSNKYIGYHTNSELIQMDKKTLNYFMGLCYLILSHPQIRGFSSCG
jgi:hypothetical protein